MSHLKMRIIPVDLAAARLGDLIGYTQAGREIRLIGGGAVDIVVTDDDGPDDDDALDSSDPDDDEDDDEEDDDEEDEDTPAARRKAKSKPADPRVASLEARLKKANQQAMVRRQYLTSHGIDYRTGEPLVNDAGDDGGEGETVTPPDGNGSTPAPQGLTKKDLDRAAARAAAAAEMTYLPVLMEYAAKSALAEAGWQGKDVGLAMRLLDPQDIDFDPRTRELSGLDEQIDRIKDEFPDWFRSPTARPPARRRGAATVDGGRKPVTRTDARPKGWAEQLEERWLSGE